MFDAAALLMFSPAIIAASILLTPLLYFFCRCVAAFSLLVIEP